MSHPSGWVDRPRSECDVPSARIKLTCPPCPKRVTRLARSDLLAPPEASYSPRPKRLARPARSDLLASPEATCSPRPKRLARPARSDLLAPLEATCSPRPKRVTRPARIVLCAYTLTFFHSGKSFAGSG